MKVIQISIIGRISGNVNADENVGNRITIKKMYTSSGEIYPYVSARCIRRCIREALKNKGFEVDPYINKVRNQICDAGNPVKYIDNDIFGYFVPESKPRVRFSPIVMSPFKALRNTPIKVEFAHRITKGEEPVPYEIEVADFVGKIDCIIYDWIGKFGVDINYPQNQPKELEKEDIEKRLRAFLKVFLTPEYVFPRRANYLQIPEYYGSIIYLGNSVKPIFAYFDYEEENKVNKEKLNRLRDLIDNGTLFGIEYIDNFFDNSIEIKSVKEAINEIINYYLGE
jgi:CRISPR-associated protein Cst2